MSFVTRSGSEFRYNGKKYRFIGANYYPFIVSSVNQSSMQQIFSLGVSAGITVFRTWCFDAGYLPTDSGGNFRYLTYPLGTNMLTNSSFETDTTGYSLGTGFSRSNEDSYDGSWSVKQVTTSGFARISFSVTVTANTDYVFSFRTKINNISGSPPVIFIGTGTGDNSIKDAGFNTGTGGEWKFRQVTFNSGANTTVYVSLQNWNGNVTAFFDSFHFQVAPTPELVWREATLVQLDMLLDEAQKKGIKLILSLADNPTYHTKQTYVDWANSIYNEGLSTSFPYIGFFTSDNCKQMYKDFFYGLATRVNTINGRTYKDDDTIFSWELGNELRLDRDDPNGVNSLVSDNLALMSNSGGWIDTMSTYFKSIDSNHLVSFSSCSHTWQYASGDTVSNGTYYGVDYDIVSALPNIDYLDFHMYPTQGGDGSALQKFGQRLGMADSISGNGFRIQLQDYVRVAHKNGKPCVCGEIGFVKEVTASNNNYPLYPRHNAFKKIFEDFFGAGGDGMILWSVSNTGGGTYSINLGDTDGEATEDNTNDAKLVSLIKQRNEQFKNRRINVNSIKNIQI